MLRRFSAQPGHLVAFRCKDDVRSQQERQLAPKSRLITSKRSKSGTELVTLPLKSR